jgi:SH3-like domain-containing protein
MTDPSAGSSVVAVLEKGHRVEWMGEQDVWLEIRWNEKTGWVKKSSLLFFL